MQEQVHIVPKNKVMLCYYETVCFFLLNNILEVSPRSGLYLQNTSSQIHYYTSSQYTKNQVDQLTPRQLNKNTSMQVHGNHHLQYAKLKVNPF